jgi:hypothetical protein
MTYLLVKHYQDPEGSIHPVNTSFPEESGIFIAKGSRTYFHRPFKLLQADNMVQKFTKRRFYTPMLEAKISTRGLLGFKQPLPDTTYGVKNRGEDTPRIQIVSL